MGQPGVLPVQRAMGLQDGQLWELSETHCTPQCCRLVVVMETGDCKASWSRVKVE